NITVAYSDWVPAVPNDDSGPGTLDVSTGNISADPGFVSGTDLHLRSDSGLIDAGDPDSPSATPNPPESTTDLDGRPRKAAGKGDGVERADIGALEYDPPPSTTTPLPGDGCAAIADAFARADCALQALLDPGLCAPDTVDRRVAKALKAHVHAARGEVVR